MFSIIAAIGKDRELGKDNNLIFDIKEDMKFFREKTLGHKVVMGRNTWESLPSKLKSRENIVVSSHDFDGPDLIIHNLDDFIAKNKDSDEEVFVIGGGMIYRQFLPYAKVLYLTEVEAGNKDATVFFPDFDKSKYEKTIAKKGSGNDLTYAFCKYVKK